MRKLMAMLAIVCASVTMSSHSWALAGLGDLSFDGSMEVSGVSANNERDFGNVNTSTNTTNDRRGDTSTRVRLGMNANVTEGVTARVELTRTAARAPSAAMYGGSARPTTLTTEESSWVFDNAYVDIADLWNMDARLGRQYIGDQGDLVWHIGPKSDDSLTITSIDGLRLECAKGVEKPSWAERIHLTLFTGKANEDDTVANTDADDGAGDVNLSNIQLDLKVIPNGNVRLGYLIGNDSNSAAANDNNKLNIWRLGANGGVMENMLTYRAELLGNSGEFNSGGVNGDGTSTDLKYEGTAIDLGIGLNTPETAVGSFGINLNWLMASGDDNTVDDKDESFHDFTTLGLNTSDRYFGEIFGKSNTMGGGSPLGQGLDTGVEGQGLEVLNIGLTYKPKFSTKTWFKLDWFAFSRGEDSVKTSLTPGAADTKVGDDFGSEIDLSVGYNHTENVLIEAGWATFSPDDATLNTAGYNFQGAHEDENVNKLFARATVKWGGDK